MAESSDPTVKRDLEADPEDGHARRRLALQELRKGARGQGVPPCPSCMTVEFMRPALENQQPAAPCFLFDFPSTTPCQVTPSQDGQPQEQRYEILAFRCETCGCVAFGSRAFIPAGSRCECGHLDIAHAGTYGEGSHNGHCLSHHEDPFGNSEFPCRCTRFSAQVAIINQ